MYSHLYFCNSRSNWQRNTVQRCAPQYLAHLSSSCQKSLHQLRRLHSFILSEQIAAIFAILHWRDLYNFKIFISHLISQKVMVVSWPTSIIIYTWVKCAPKCMKDKIVFPTKSHCEKCLDILLQNVIFTRGSTPSLISWRHWQILLHSSKLKLEFHVKEANV